MVVVDTSIIIDHIRQKNSNTLFKQLFKKYSSDEIAISIITVQELYGGESTRKREVEQALLAIISLLRILPYNYEVSKLAGEIDRDIGRPMDFADAAIAATAIINGAQLVTLNKKDFSEVKDLDVIK